MVSSTSNSFDLSTLFTYVDNHRQDFLQRLIDYLRTPVLAHTEKE